MAVTVGSDQYLVLDDEFRIAEVGPAALASFGPLRGRRIFDVFPDSEPLFRPHYERAIRSGSPVEFATYYDGLALHVCVVPAPRRLHVTWTVLARLDVLTLDGLAASLDTTLAAIEDAERALEHDRGRQRLTVVGGA